MVRFFAAAAALALITSQPAHASTLVTGANKCLDAKGGAQNGGQVQLWECSPGNTNQQWAVSGGQVRAPNGKCLDVRDGVLADGRALQLWDCVPNSRNQAFEASGGRIKHAGGNFCVDVSGGQFTNGTTVQLWTCSGGPNQAWAARSTTDAPVAQDPGGRGNAYLQAQGTRIVTPQGQPITLRGTNIGGWLVPEGWMNGYKDDSDKDPFRFSTETLERRFGEARAAELVRIWQDRFFTARDLDNLAALGVNAIRVPFGWRTLQRGDGSWIKDGAGHIDFARLDWVVAEAAKRGIYTILDFHIWQGQQQNYSLISENSDGGRAAQARAAAIWTQVAKHYLGNGWVAGFDAINEPTGSYDNQMQDALYRAIRAVDPDRLIFMESTSVNPGSKSWRQVAYSIHQYGMMGTNFGANQAAFQKDVQGDLATFERLNIPAYIGEFMCQQEGETLGWLLGQYRARGLHWTSWTYKTVDMGAWGLCNLPGSVRVDVLRDDADTIARRWGSIGDCVPQGPVVAAFRAALR